MIPKRRKRDIIKRKSFFLHEKYIVFSKSIQNSQILAEQKKKIFFSTFFKKKKGTRSNLRNRCIISDRGRSVFRKFKLNRSILKKYILNKEVPTINKIK